MANLIGMLFKRYNNSGTSPGETPAPAPAPPQISITYSGPSNENSQTITWQVLSNGAYPDSTTLYYTISGTGIAAADFSAAGASNSLTGSFSFTSGTWTKQLVTVPDLTTEGLETASLTVWLESSYITNLGSSAVTISDTSTTPPEPYNQNQVFPTLSIVSGSLVPIVTNTSSDSIAPTLGIMSGTLVPIVTNTSSDSIAPTLGIMSGTLE